MVSARQLSAGQGSFSLEGVKESRGLGPSLEPKVHCGHRGESQVHADRSLAVKQLGSICGRWLSGEVSAGQPIQIPSRL